jgi:uncharacterized protein YwqG
VETDLSGYISELGLGEHREYLLRVARPSIEILTARVPVTRGCSKFGGSPDVPAGFEWPHHEFGPYRFIGQVNLADLPDGPHGLPGSGLLSFFYADDENGESFWQDPDYVRVYRFDAAGALAPAEPPEEVRYGATVTLAFRAGMDVPTWDVAVHGEPMGESLRDAYWALEERLHPTGRYLLGYPRNPTLGYDPTPGPEWRSLLTLTSSDELAWSWHDGDTLVTFIEEQRLRAGDFSHIVADAG